MTPHSSLEHDLALKRFATAPKDRKPNYPWRDAVRDKRSALPEVQVLCPQGPEPFDLGEIADTVGKSLTTLLLARGETSIFTEAHKQFVARIAEEVATNLTALALRQRPLRVDLNELYVLIEKTLVDNSAYDVAKSLLYTRGAKLGTDRVSCSTPVRLIRRNGHVVPWNEAKIEIAIRKSFLALQQNPAPAAEIARAVTARALATREPFLHIEEVQDVVQEELMRAGHFKVAEAFIIYRSMRTAVRGHEATPAPAVAQPSMIVVVRPGGETFLWDGHDLRLRIEYAAAGLALPLSADELEHELRRSVYDNISQADLAATVARNARALIERDSEFARFAGRLQLTYLYEEALGWDIVRDGINRLREFHCRVFSEYIFEAVGLGLLQPRLIEAFQLEKLAAALDPAADLALDLAAVQTLAERFLVTARRDGAKVRHLEVPQFLWMRVAMGLNSEERRGRDARCLELFELLKSRRFLPAAPVLAHAGTPKRQLVAHYAYHVDNHLEGVMQRAIADNAYLAVRGGSLAGAWTAVQAIDPEASEFEARGLDTYLDLHRAMLGAVGPVEGAAFVESWHADLPGLLVARAGESARPALVLAQWMPDLFVQRVVAGAEWSLFRPADVADLPALSGAAFARRYAEYEALAAQGSLWSRRLPAAELWRDLVQALLDGRASVAFKDAFALRAAQDQVGPLRSPTFATEFALNTADGETASAALGAVALDAHLDAAGALDLAALRHTVRVAVRALDNVLDLHRFPTESARRAAQRHRPLGLGVMGLARALHLKGLAFGSAAAEDFNDACLEALAHAATAASAELAAERGCYSTFKGSKWDRGLFPIDTAAAAAAERGLASDLPRDGRIDWQPVRAAVATHGLRNASLLALAPTPWIDQIAGTSASVEPASRNVQVESTLSGEFVVFSAELVRDLKARGLWSAEMVDTLKYFDGEVQEIAAIPADLKEKHLTAGDIDPSCLLRAAARRQKWLDQAQALHLELPPLHADIGAVSALLLTAWRLGLKSLWRLSAARAAKTRAS
ncbi:MAG TPA: ribonucleoside-diphosphate reductase subunit alpha [Opitutaceae bacterium]|nr:ribonucleoside-diphosphate reductase subunit alpha [Opitutaceae bacterium]